MAICIICQRTIQKDSEHPWHTCNEIVRQLNELDLRAVRAILEHDEQRIKDIIEQKDKLRAQFPKE
jgi:hypothetical protein